jgi:hypothetical protein
MKLNYRDRIILLVVVSIVILLAGFFGLIKPRYADIKDNNVKLDQVKAEWDGLDAKIQQIPTMQENIKQLYNDSKQYSDTFITNGSTPSFTPEALDQFMQETIDSCNLQITNLEVSSASSTTLGYYYYTPSIPTSAMLDLADLNGEYTKEINAKLEESNAISQRTAEDVLSQQYGIRFTASKNDLWTFMDTIDQLDKSILIESVNISDTDFGYDADTGKLKSDAKTNKSGEGVSEVTIVVNIYSTYELDEPVLD